MKVLGIIPSRYESTRFPGKSLIDIMGKTMIQRVYEQAKKSKQLDDLVVATDDQRIFEEVKGFGGSVIITGKHHKNGTERCLEVAESLQAQFVVNIQGDEPFIQPEQIDKLCSIISSDTDLATLIKRIKDPSDLGNPNLVKVVKSLDDHALYFSRSPIPFDRSMNKAPTLPSKKIYWKHIGIYAYRTEVLSQIVKLEESALEKMESLEQLRWLENGYKIKTAETHFESIGIDTPEDLDHLIAKMKTDAQ
ncbi:MAG: 3-deoxy-manno-octulosonate cytidylyltransferase [Cytophagales bacterium]|jgi:3-deoxy-manno-octulosonate cytidylyltransferase (CMP-KDO synthetase)|tara:strand:- start:1288 stop:2034 length:747 start_codon:yes stop_codon:yes gene_type:complete